MKKYCKVHPLYCYAFCINKLQMAATFLLSFYERIDTRFLWPIFKCSSSFHLHFFSHCSGCCSREKNFHLNVNVNNLKRKFCIQRIVCAVDIISGSGFCFLSVSFYNCIATIKSVMDRKYVQITRSLGTTAT